MSEKPEFIQENAWKAIFSNDDGEKYELVFAASDSYKEVFEALKAIDEAFDLTEDGYTMDSVSFIGIMCTPEAPYQPSGESKQTKEGEQ